MPNNVKSCKKIDEKAQTAKFTVLQGEISSTVLKIWKTRKTIGMASLGAQNPGFQGKSNLVMLVMW